MRSCRLQGPGSVTKGHPYNPLGAHRLTHLPYPCAHQPPLHQIPCGHAYCRSCLAELRAKDVPQTCPLCRAELPPGLDGLYDLGFRAYKRVRCMVDRGEISWASLPAAEQEEMDEAVAMLTEASSQVW